VAQAEAAADGLALSGTTLEGMGAAAESRDLGNGLS
jgi:hypothetical protein